MKNPAISIIIPAYNEEKRIYKTLMSVTKATAYFKIKTGEDVEIILVDNASEDKTIEIAGTFNIKILHERKHNISRVRNTGAKAAKGNILCFLDADSEVSEDVFIHIYEAMLSGKYIGGGVKMYLDEDKLLYKILSLGSLVASHLLGISAVGKILIKLGDLTKAIMPVRI